MLPSNTNLEGANLESTDLSRAMFDSTYITRNTNLKKANIYDAIFSRQITITDSQILSTCNWDKAVLEGQIDDGRRDLLPYRGLNEQHSIDRNWMNLRLIGVPYEESNQRYIQTLKQIESSQHQEKIDCSKWN